jgi:hypothetical protein
VSYLDILVEEVRRDDGTNGKYTKTFRLFRYFRLFRHLSYSLFEYPKIKNPGEPFSSPGFGIFQPVA